MTPTIANEENIGSLTSIMGTKRPKQSYPINYTSCGIDGFQCKTCFEYLKKLDKKPYFGYSENIPALKAVCCQARLLLVKKNHLCLSKLKFNLQPLQYH